MQSLIDFLNKLVEDFTWRRLSVIIASLLLFVVSIVVYEYYTNSFFLSKAEKTVNLIDQLSKLPPEVLGEGKESLTNLTEAVINEIGRSVHGNTFFQITFPPVISKILATLTPWVITLLLVFLAQKEDKLNVIGGVILLGIIFSFVGVILPWQGIIWSTYWAYPLIHFSLVMVILIAYGSRK